MQQDVKIKHHHFARLCTSKIVIVSQCRKPAKEARIMDQAFIYSPKVYKSMTTIFICQFPNGSSIPCRPCVCTLLMDCGTSLSWVCSTWVYCRIRIYSSSTPALTCPRLGSQYDRKCQGHQLFLFVVSCSSGSSDKYVVLRILYVHIRRWRIGGCTSSLCMFSTE